MSTDVMQTSWWDILAGILLGIVWSLLAIGAIRLAYKILERICR